MNMTQLIHFKSQFNIHMHGLTTFEYIYITSHKCSLLCIPTSQVYSQIPGTKTLQLPTDLNKSYMLQPGPKETSHTKISQFQQKRQLLCHT